MKDKLTLRKLKTELKKYNFKVSRKHESILLNWAKFWYRGAEHLKELVSEIASMGKCEACKMPEYAINHEREAGDMQNHLVCEGCNKKCDGGIYKRENDYYSFRDQKCGAYVFIRLKGKDWNGSPLIDTKYFCEKCKFEKLCGDCGNIHNGNLWADYKEKYEDFYLCVNCGIDQEDERHETEHFGKNEPDIFCPRCEGFAEKYNEASEAYQAESLKRNQPGAGGIN
jgi:hypothetical protein